MTVTAESSDTLTATVSAALTFTTTNWDVEQTVTVTGVNNGTPGDRTAVVTHRASGGGYSLAGVDTVRVTVVDDDAGLVVSATADTVSEAGGMATYGVALAVQPNDTVTVRVTSTDTLAATVSPAVLTFTEQNWNVTRTVTVTGVNNDVLGDRTASVTHGATGGGYSLADVDTVTVTVANDDAAVLDVSRSAVTVSEAGGTATYTVALGIRPADTVRVEPASSNDSVATASPAVLTFTEADWGTAQTVTVTGVDDQALGVRTVEVMHDASGGGFDLTAADTVTVTVADDDTDRITVVPDTVVVEELGGDGDLHGCARGRTDGHGHGNGGELGHVGGDGVAGGPDVHGGGLEHAADGDGDGGLEMTRRATGPPTSPTRPRAVVTSCRVWPR